MNEKLGVIFVLVCLMVLELAWDFMHAQKI